MTGGSDLLTKALKERLNATILLNSTVKRISHSDEVTVSYQRGQKSNFTDLKADFVLVTTTAKVALFIDFDPPLSIKKMDVHYDSSTKVLLTFKNRFWEDDGIQGGKSITDGPSRFIYYPKVSQQIRPSGSFWLPTPGLITHYYSLVQMKTLKSWL